MENIDCNSIATNLHQNQEDLLKEKSTKSDSNLHKVEMLKLIQELKEQKEELELQNKKLIFAKEQTENASKKYAELYDYTSSGYFTLSRAGNIIDLNLIGKNMLGKERLHLINTLFKLYVSDDKKQDFHNFFDKVFNDKAAITCELTLINSGSLATYVQLTGIIIENGKQCFITAIDITKHKQAEEALVKEKERLSAIIKGTNVGTWEWNFHTGEVFYNDQYAEMIGYTIEEISPITNETWRRYAHPDDLKKSDELLKSHTNGESDYYECELRMKHKNGDWIWILDKGRIHEKDKEGKPLWISGTHQDITERKHAEENIRLSKITYRGILNSITELIYIQDEEGRFLDVNEATEKKYGYNKDYFIGKTPEFLSAPGKNDLEAITKAIRLAWSGIAQSFEFWGITKNGSIFPKEVNLSLGSYFGKSVIIAVARDITERKQAEDAFRESENRYRLLIESANEGVLVAQGTNFKFVNSKIMELTGYSEKELLTIPFIEFIHPDYRELLMTNYKKRINDDINNTSSYPVKLLRKDKTIKWVEFSGVKIEWEGEPASMNFITDITERRQIRQSLKESEKRYRALVEWSPEAIVVHRGGKILYVNPASIKTVRANTAQDLLGKSVLDLIHPDFRKIMMERSKMLTNIADSTSMMEAKFLSLDGTEIDVETQSILINYNGELAVQASFHDITKRKQVEEALKKTEERYRAMVEWSPEAIGVHRDGKILYANPTALKIIGATSLQVLAGKPILSLVHHDFHKIILDRMKNISEQETVLPPIELKFIKMNGTVIDVEVQSTLIEYDGAPAVQVSVRDITYKKELENLLNKANNLARLGGWEFDLINNKLYFSDITKDILEVEADFEPNLKTAINFFNLGKSREKNLNIIKESIEHDKNWDIELNILTAKGNDRWVCAMGETEFINGKPIRINGSFQDINTRKKTEIALQGKIKELKDYKFALDESAIITITDKNGLIKTVNDNFCRLSKYSRDELIGKTHLFINSNYHSKEFFKDLWDTILSGKVWRGVIKNKTKDGEYYWVDTTIVPFLDANKKPFQYLAIRFDITEKKNTEEEIIKAKERAEESDRLKSAFLANMSHEIRTPMNGILGFASLLKEANLSSENQQEYIKIIDESGARLLNIINDIIDISKIESKEMKVYITEININEQIDYIFNFFKPEVTTKGIHLHYKKGLPTNEAIIKTDSEKIYAILINLVKNAIKFCDQGTIEFGYTLKAKSEPAELEFFIKDTGVGIPKDRQQAVFDRFIQADISDKRAFQGAGLGLSISKAYVEMLGGKIRVESEEGKGSTFYFTIPYNVKTKGNSILKKSSSEKETENQIKNLKILIVEDDNISKLLILKAVKMFSKEILKVNTGVEAVEACQNNPDIDLVMMDINMPDMNGYEATKQIRQFNKNVIIIAQTANALSSDRNEAINAGCNDYISKPINMNLLSELIQKHFK